MQRRGCYQEAQKWWTDFHIYQKRTALVANIQLFNIDEAIKNIFMDDWLMINWFCSNAFLFFFKMEIYLDKYCPYSCLYRDPLKINIINVNSNWHLQFFMSLGFVLKT